MAATISTVTKGRSDEVWGRRKVAILRVTLDNAYPTGGLTFDPRTAAGQVIPQIVLLKVRFVAGATGPLTRSFAYDYTNKKIFAWVTSTGVEVANGVDLSGCVFDVIVVGD